MANRTFILKLIVLFSIEKCASHFNDVGNTAVSVWNPSYNRQVSKFQFNRNGNSVLPGRRFDMCTFCRQVKPWCIPLYCAGGILPPPRRDMCTYCKEQAHWCIPLYCPGHGFAAPSKQKTDVTSVGIPPSGSLGGLCSFCRYYYPPCIHLYCPGGNAGPSAAWGVSRRSDYMCMFCRYIGHPCVANYCSGSNGFVPHKNPHGKFKNKKASY